MHVDTNSQELIAGEVKEDELCEDFVLRKKLRQVQVLLASLKQQSVLVQEAEIKIKYVKKQFANSLQNSADLQRQLKEKDDELAMKKMELEMKEEQLQA